MRALISATLWLAAGLASAAPARAAAPDGIEPSMYWHLGFGGSTLEAGYGLALGYRSSDYGVPQVRLAELDIDSHHASARLAGLPLMYRSYQSNEDGAAATPDSILAEKPWYARSWVLWTVGGIAASALIGSGSGHNEGASEHPSGSQGNTLSESNGQFCVSDNTSCVPYPLDGGP